MESFISSSAVLLAATLGFVLAGRADADAKHAAQVKQEHDAKQREIARRISELLVSAKECELQDRPHGALLAAQEILELDAQCFEAYFVLTSNEEDDSKYEELVAQAREHARGEKQRRMVDVVRERPSKQNLKFAVPPPGESPSTEIWYLLFVAKYCHAAQQSSRAIEYCESVIADKRATNLDQALALVFKGHAFAGNEHQVEETIKTYKLALEKYPNATAALLNLANIYIGLPDHVGQAKEMVEQAHRINPNDFMIQVTMGHVYTSEQKMDEAEKSFLRALELNQRAADAYIGLTGIYLRKGENKKALELLSRASKNQVDDPLFDFSKLEANFFTLNFTNFKQVMKRVLASPAFTDKQKEEVNIFGSIVQSCEMLFQKYEPLRQLVGQELPPWSKKLCSMERFLNSIEFSIDLSSEVERFEWDSWLKLLVFLSTAYTPAQERFIENLEAFFQAIMHPSQQHMMILMTNMNIAWWIIDDIVQKSGKMYDIEWNQRVQNFVETSKSDPRRGFVKGFLKK